MLANNWDIRPGDWVECADGRRGPVLSTCSWPGGGVVAVEVGFDWYGLVDIISWAPEK